MKDDYRCQADYQRRVPMFDLRQPLSGWEFNSPGRI